MRTHTRVLKTIEEVRFDIAYRWFCGFEVDDASRGVHSGMAAAKRLCAGADAGVGERVR